MQVELMNQQMMQNMSHHMFWMWGVALILLLLALLAIAFFLKRANQGNLLISNLVRSTPLRLTGRLEELAEHASDQRPVHAHDTIFILPDISHYTRFMTCNEFSFAHAQHIIFSLINAMIACGSRTLELSKLEGDAALFYVDADRFPSERIGEAVIDIFRAFFSEQERLIQSNLCPCRACQSIGGLDLKVFVHRGEAARFEFRGSVDHFGTDVIILHRMMKNSVEGDRYIMVTEAAREMTTLPNLGDGYDVEEAIEHLGGVKAHVFELDDLAKSKLTEAPQTSETSTSSDTLEKLKLNSRSLLAAFKALFVRSKRAHS